MHTILPRDLLDFDQSEIRLVDPIDNGHGEITGFRQNVPAYGTYEVHANCSGTSLIYFPGAPSPVETAFVIVAHGDEVKGAVMAPARNIVAASLWRVGR